MISKKMQKLLKNNSVVREMFEEGNRLREIYGSSNVFDFSLGNPNVETPKKINEVIKKIVDNTDSLYLHGYMSNSGYVDVRKNIADNINKKYDTNFTYNNIIMTVGAASGLNIVLKSILDKDDEVIVFSPYFSEYNNYIENYDGVVIPLKTMDNTFLPDLDLLDKSINNKTKAIIINTPNNPTGVIYPEDIIKGISDILDKKQKEYNTDIYLISDEPYRELVYTNISVPYVTKYYNNTFVVYSFSKSLSLAGERIGYVVIPSEMNDSTDMIDAVTISNRIIGCVNAPSLMQRVVSECLDEAVDIDYYKKNRDKLIEIVERAGFSYVRPDGAFYLFMKCPIEDDRKFCNIAKKYNLLFVPASSFGTPGYVRVAYCVSYSTIVNSLDAFIKLGEEF